MARKDRLWNEFMVVGTRFENKKGLAGHIARRKQFFDTQNTRIKNTLKANC